MYFTQIVQMALNGAQNRFIKGKYKKYSVSSVSTVFDTLHYAELYKVIQICLHTSLLPSFTFCNRKM